MNMQTTTNIHSIAGDAAAHSSGEDVKTQGGHLMTNSNSFVLVPTRISRSKAVLKTRGNKSQVSTVFFAEFGGKAHHKTLRRVNWVLTDLLKSFELENEILLGFDESPLYRLDWSSVPTFGDFKKHYPKSLR